MEYTFEEYVKEWFHDFLNEREDNKVSCEEVFDAMVDRDPNDDVSEYIDKEYIELVGKEQAMFHYLYDLSADEIYKNLFEYNKIIDGIPSRYEFVEKMLKEVIDDMFDYRYSFVDEFLDDIIEHVADSDEPLGFFQNLSYGGCQSGMIGMLIYNNDCLDIYGRHGNDMEEFREEMEEELGSSISSKNSSARHYVWICWLCYEELAYRIGRELFPDEF